MTRMFKWRLFRIIRARPHLSIGAGAGLVSLLPLEAVHQIPIRAVLAWDIGSAVFLALTAVTFFTQQDRDITTDAKRQQEGEWSVFALTLLGAIMSFAAIFIFSNAGHKAHQALYLPFVIATLALSWLTTNVMFAYRYAHEFYTKTGDSSDFDGGIEFPNDKHPDYLDFIYFSFVLGMTFQVSDCNVTSKKLRRLATLQGLIGFLFNTVILALSVNIAASLL
jgi:uncharacterized membrane protein